MKSRKLSKALNTLKNFKSKSSEKAKKTKAHIRRLCEMQKYVDFSTEKRDLLIKTIRENKDEEGVNILDKGVVLYIELLDVIDKISKDLEYEKIEHKIIQGSCTKSKRDKINKWFSENPKNKVIIISDAGGQSINLNQTNELILYNIPKGSGKFKQTIGRIVRSFGKFNHFNVHIIQINKSIDEYKQILLSTKTELEEEILTCDVIPFKDSGSFDANVMKRIKKDLLWKEGKNKNE